jgi:hypothetical protein
MSKEYDEEISLNGETENCEEISEPLRTLKLKEMEIRCLQEQIMNMRNGVDYWKDERDEIYDLKKRLGSLQMDYEDSEAEKMCLIAECRRLEDRLKAANDRISSLESRLERPREEEMMPLLKTLLENTEAILREVKSNE